MKKVRVGYLTEGKDNASTRIRTGIFKHLNLDSQFKCEPFSLWHKFDIVIFVKHPRADWLALMRLLKKDGVKVVYDVNANFYDAPSDYTRRFKPPHTPEQTKNAIAMTEMADLVVADSTVLMIICRRFNDNVVVIHDAVDTDLYCPA